MPGILKSFPTPITQHQFVQICVLAGTEYNTENQHKIAFAVAVSKYKDFDKTGFTQFPNWNNGGFNDNSQQFDKICNLFVINSECTKYLNLNDNNVKNTPKINISKIVEIMEPHGFVFVN